MAFAESAYSASSKVNSGLELAAVPGGQLWQFQFCNILLSSGVEGFFFTSGQKLVQCVWVLIQLWQFVWVLVQLWHLWSSILKPEIYDHMR